MPHSISLSKSKRLQELRVLILWFVVVCGGAEFV
jgi:hypothetical protein